MILGFLEYKDNLSFLVFGEKTFSFYTKFLSVLAKTNDDKACLKDWWFFSW